MVKCWEMECSRKTRTTNGELGKRHPVYMSVLHEMQLTAMDGGCLVIDKNRGPMESFDEKQQLVWLVREHSDWVIGFFE